MKNLKLFDKYQPYLVSFIKLNVHLTIDYNNSTVVHTTQYHCKKKEKIVVVI